MIITSRNAKYLKLGKEIDKVTLRMAHLKRVIELSQQAFRSAMEVFGSYQQIDSKGKAVKVEGTELERVVQAKHILDNLNQAVEASGAEFDRNVESLGELEFTLTRLEKTAKRQAEDKKKKEMKVAREANTQNSYALAPEVEPVPAPVVTTTPKPNR